MPVSSQVPKHEHPRNQQKEQDTAEINQMHA